MAISIAGLTHGNGTSASSFTTASVTPTNGHVVLLYVLSFISLGSPAVPTISGCSLTWTQVASNTWDTGVRNTLFKGVGTPSTGTISISFGAVTQGTCAWAVIDVSGADTTNPVKQTSFGSGSGVTATPTPLGAFSSPSNSVLAMGAGSSTTTSTTPKSGYTETYSGVGSGGAGNVEVEWENANDTTPTFGISPSGSWSITAIEVQAAAAATTPQRTLMGVGL